MRAESWNEIKDIFHRALEVEPAGREKFLADACQGNDEVRREVESLLTAHQSADELYENPVVGFDAEADWQPERVGVYKVIREIGRGGMGAVFLAVRDDDEFQKQVAVKFIRGSFASAESVRRFRQERQILAALEHPFIARLLDGGTTAEGLPYLVMEYVDGLPLVDFCWNKLTTHEQLRIFQKICAAVHYAHQHLVIHRDLKPSNIMVTKDGEPKLLDFGVAKLLNDKLKGETTAKTAPATRIMTLEYAAPEQLRGEVVTTAADIYSLGVCLYELLTGARPFAFENQSLEKIIQTVCSGEPPKPSSVLRRNSIPGRNPKSEIRNPKLLDGDVDNIVLMAMRKEAGRRYKSAEQFAEDIGRHLDGLPIIARQDSFAYRAGKFIKRNKVGVAASVFVVLAVLFGVAATLWQANLARRQAKIADEQRERAQTAQAKAERINRFMQNMFGSVAPEMDGREVKVVEVLEKAERQAREDLAAQPEILAGVLQSIGGSYLGLAQYEAAERILRDALEIYKQQSGSNQLETGRCVYQLADVLVKTQRYAEAEPLLRQAIEIQRRYQPETNSELVESLAALGTSFVNREEIAQAEPILQESLTLAQNAFGEGSDESLLALHALASLYSEMKNPAREIEIYRQIISALQKKPSAKDALATTNLNLGMTLLYENNLSEAEPPLLKGSQLYGEIYGEDNVRFATTLVLLAQLRVRQRRYAEAQAEAEKALSIQQKHMSPDNYYVFGTTWGTLGTAMTKQNKPREGEPFLRRALDALRKTYPADHWGISLGESRLGECLAAQRRFAEAEPLLLRAYENIKTKLGENNFMTVEAAERIVKLYEDWAQPDKAANYRTRKNM